MTYITFYQNEVRPVTLTILDQDDVAWNPTTAFVAIIDDVGSPVQYEIPAVVSSNTVSTVVSTNVTETPGSYTMVWRLVQSAYTYYHKTGLIVEEL